MAAPPARGGVANICCRGRNRTCGRQSNNLPSVPAHKPYKIRGRPNAGRPHAYTGDRHALHCAPSRRFRIVRDRGHTCALGSGAPLRTYFERLRATCQRWAALESRARFGPGASVRNRTPTGGVRNRCSTNELRTREAEKCRSFAGASSDRARVSPERFELSPHGVKARHAPFTLQTRY